MPSCLARTHTVRSTPALPCLPAAVAQAPIPSLARKMRGVGFNGRRMVRQLMREAAAAGLNAMRTWAHTTDPVYPMQVRLLLLLLLLMMVVVGLGLLVLLVVVGLGLLLQQPLPCIRLLLPSLRRQHLLAWPQIKPGVYDEGVLRGLDYVIAEAGRSGIKTILSFVDNWKYAGGVDEVRPPFAKEGSLSFRVVPAASVFKRGRARGAPPVKSLQCKGGELPPPSQPAHPQQASSKSALLTHSPTHVPVAHPPLVKPPPAYLAPCSPSRPPAVRGLVPKCAQARPTLPSHQQAG